MNRDFVDKFSFVSGVLTDQRGLLLSFESDELSTEEKDHSMFLEYKNKTWNVYNDLKNFTVTSSVRDINNGLVYFLGYWGEILEFSSEKKGERKQKMIQDGRKYAPMREIKMIGRKLYYVGLGRQIYSISRNGVVENESTIISTDEDIYVGFEAIDGNAKGLIWAVGLSGDIWMYNSEQWRQMCTPTNVHLTSVICTSSGLTYVGGVNGILLEIDGDRVDVIEQDITNEDIWSIVEFDERLFFATTRYVYTMDLVSKEISPVDFGSDMPGTCFNLTTNGVMLASIGQKDIFLYDRKSWKRLI